MLQSQMAGSGAMFGGLAAKEAMYQNAYPGATQAAAPPKTIASAISRIEGLHERLSGVRNEIAAISDAIGGPRVTASGENAKNVPSPSGVVYRLNESADQAHSILSDIESLLASIGRALG